MWLAINAGLQSKITSLIADGLELPAALGKGALATYFLFTFTIMFSYAPLQAIIPAEALETTMRAKGLGLGAIIQGLMGFLNQFAGPIALKNIGWKYILFFAIWDVVEACLWYFLGIEGQGRTLEEMNWVYDQPNPVKASKKAARVQDAEEAP